MPRLLLLGALLACSTEHAQEAPWPEPVEEDLVLSWHATYPGGEDRFTLRRSGESFFDRRARRHIEVERTLPEDTVLQLRNDLRAANCCAYVGPWADTEYTVELRVRMPALACDLHMPAHAFDLDSNLRTSCGDRIAEEWGRPRYRTPAPAGALVAP